MVVKFPTGARPLSQRASRLLPYKTYRAVYVALTDCPTCGFDPFTMSAKDPSCTTCNGTGRTETQYTSYVPGYVVWKDEVQIFLQRGVVATGEMGDCLFNTTLPFEGLMRKIMEAERGYIDLGDQRIKPVSVMRSRIGTEDIKIACACQVIGEGVDE